MQKVELHKVCKIGNGFAFKSEDYLETGIPLLRISNINNGIVNFKDDSICVAKNYLTTKKDFIVEKGDVVIALSGATTGKYGIYINDEPALLNQRIGIIKSNVSTKLDSKYFYFYLNILKVEILRKAGGAAQPNISTKEIGNLEIPLPPLPTQQKIAAILDKADELRQYNKQLIKKYEMLTQSLFLDMFGDPVRNEKGWEKKKLGIVTNMKAGKFIAASDIFLEKSNEMFPCYGGNGLRGFVKSNTHEGEFVLIGRQGALCGNVKVTNGKFHATEHAIVCSPIMKYQTLWLYHLLKMMNLNRFSTGAAQPGLNVGTLVDLEIMIVPYDIQNQFAERVAVIEAQKKHAQEALAKSEELFQSLLQRAFKGELN